MGMEIVVVPFGGNAQSQIGKLHISVSEGEGRPSRNRADAVSVRMDGHEEMQQQLKPGSNLRYGPTPRGKFEVRYVGPNSSGQGEFRVCLIPDD